LSWHRPYLALYEQVLYQHILEAVNEFPEGELRQRYAIAASTWRVPYWDWAAPPQSGSVYASVLAAPTIQVTTASGDAEIANPLYSYKFHPVSGADFYWQPVGQILDAYMPFVVLTCSSLLHGPRLCALLIRRMLVKMV
jgi:tyrosinase